MVLPLRIAIADATQGAFGRGEDRTSVLELLILNEYPSENVKLSTYAPRTIYL